MIKRFLLCAVLLIAPLSWADWAADRDGSAGYVTVTTLATAVDEAVPFCVVYLSDLPADFHTAMTAASDTDGKTIRVSTSDGTTQLACVPIGVNTSTDTGCLIFLGTGMSASVDVDYRIYVGNASLSMPTASGGMGEQAVFASYAGVYFPGVDTRDWTSGGRTLTATGSPGTAAGLEGITAADYNGTSQGHYYDGTQGVTAWGVTLEAIAQSSSITASQHAFVLASSSSSTNTAILYFDGAAAGDYIKGFYRGNSSTGSTAVTASGYSANTNYYISTSRTGGTGTSAAYIDGGSSGTESTAINSTFSPNRLSIGYRRYNALSESWLAGRVAVALLSSSVRSADYMSTMQDNWAGTMYSAGAWTALDTDCTTGSTGWVLFQTAATTSASGTLVDWTNTSNAIVDDANYATANLDPVGNYESEYLNLTNINYGTTVPTSADSYTVTVRIKRARATGGGDDISDLTVQFIDETGTRIGDNVADTLTNWPTTAASVDYTITGHTFDGSEFDADSGLAIRATGIDSATDCDARVLVAWIKIDWNCGDDAAKARGFFALTE